MSGYASASRTVRLGAVLLAAGATLGSYQSVAQEAPSGLQEITVTARRVEESLQKVPVAITAITGEQIKDLQVQSVMQLQYDAPSLIVTQGASVAGGEGQFGMRGLFNQNSSTSSPYVAAYLDGQLTTGFVIERQMFDLASVQVLSGPQGTLFGATSTAGAIVVTSHKPTDKYEGSIELGVGDYKDRDGSFVLNLPLFEHFQMRISGRVVDRDGYTKQLNPCPLAYSGLPGYTPFGQVEPSPCGHRGNFNDDRYQTFRVVTALQVTDWIDNDTTFRWYHSNTVGGVGIPTNIAGPLVNLDFGPGNLGGFTTPAQILANQQSYGIRAVYTDAAQYVHQKAWGVSNTTSVKLGDKFTQLGDLTLKNIFGYQRNTVESAIDNDGSVAPSTYEIRKSFDPSPVYSDEVQLLGSLANKQVSWIVGGFLQRTTQDGFGTSGGYPENGGTWILYGNQSTVQKYNAAGLFTLFWGPITDQYPTHIKGHQNAVYANTTVRLDQLANGLSVSGGVRETWAGTSTATNESSIAVCPLAPDNVSVIVPPCTRLAENSTHGTNWSGSLNYQVTDKLFVYFTSRHGFTPGGINAGTSIAQAYTIYKPEELTDFEFGEKADLTLGEIPVRANVAIYQSNFKDAQRGELVNQPPPLPPASITFNAQKARIRGVEASLTALLTSDLKVQANYAYTDAKFLRFDIPGPGGVGTIDRSGNAFPGAPKNNASVNASYNLPFIDRSKLGLFTLAADFFYRSGTTYIVTDTLSVSDPGVFTPGYSLANARLTWASPNTPLAITAAVTNVFDKDYIASNKDYTNSIVGYAESIYGPPRMFRLSANYSF